MQITSPSCDRDLGNSIKPHLQVTLGNSPGHAHQYTSFSRFPATGLAFWPLRAVQMQFRMSFSIRSPSIPNDYVRTQRF